MSALRILLTFAAPVGTSGSENHSFENHFAESTKGSVRCDQTLRMSTKISWFGRLQNKSFKPVDG